MFCKLVGSLRKDMSYCSTQHKELGKWVGNTFSWVIHNSGLAWSTPHSKFAHNNINCSGQPGKIISGTQDYFNSTRTGNKTVV